MKIFECFQLVCICFLLLHNLYCHILLYLITVISASCPIYMISCKRPASNSDMAGDSTGM
eukprot:c25326_g2_i1 orf=275-454(+)